MSQYVCADYTVVKVEPPTPSPLCYKYSCARAHTLHWTNSLLKDISQVRQGEFGLGGGDYRIRLCINVMFFLLSLKNDHLDRVSLHKILLTGVKEKIR